MSADERGRRRDRARARRLIARIARQRARPRRRRGARQRATQADRQAADADRGRRCRDPGRGGGGRAWSSRSASWARSRSWRCWSRRRCCWRWPPTRRGAAAREAAHGRPQGPARADRALARARSAPRCPRRRATLVDAIGVRLRGAVAAARPSSTTATEAAHEVRKLIGEQLPAFVKDYARVPADAAQRAAQRQDARRQLVDGLRADRARDRAR